MEGDFQNLIDRLEPGAILTGQFRLTGGVSADVFRLDLRLADGESTSIVLRSHGENQSGHDAEQEYLLLKALFDAGLSVPEPLLYDQGDLLPEPSVVMKFVEGSSEIPVERLESNMSVIAETLAGIHSLSTTSLPQLPDRLDPTEDILEFLPEDEQWDDLRSHLASLPDSRYTGVPCLLHGDFWPENLLWDSEGITGILDWEDAALGDPLSDVACTRLELRYKFGIEGMTCFTENYESHRTIDRSRLMLWQIYVAAAAQHFMGSWGLDPETEQHMRSEALQSIREAWQTL